MKFNRLVVALAVLIALPTLSYADLYKWKDKNGQIQYTDTPPPSNIKREDISGKKSINTTGKEPLSAVTNSQAAPAQESNKELQKFVEQQPTPEDTAAKIRQENAEREKNNKQEKEAQAKLKAENCKAAKANMESYAQGGRVYKMNEKGEREYLDDAGLKRGEIKARGEVSQYCN